MICMGDHASSATRSFWMAPFFCIGNRPNISFWMAPVYFYIEQRFSRRTFNTLIKLIMTTVYPLSRSPYISLLDCYIPFIVRKPLARYPGMEIEPIVSGSAIFRALDLGSLFFQQQRWIPLPPTTRAPPAHRAPSLIIWTNSKPTQKMIFVS